eukprot:TRINITY_DN4331_c0_g1_i2.p1 TRINITY_DN4331_c0_g1~~TRINITY_DN4331_c0_g1_i2.p1  ORF type:complete len:102 (+),score=26.41 TRINITY_DN4331_c0_g1_i2:95-400(+)
MAVAELNFCIIDETKPLNINGLDITPITVHHGIIASTSQPYLCLGFRFLGVSYLSDCCGISPEEEEKIKGSNVIILDVLREDPIHTSHFVLHQTLEKFFIV